MTTLGGATQTIENVPDTPLGRMYRQHINHIPNKDVDNLLDQYCADALLISSFTKKPLYYRGRDQFKQHMEGILGIKGLKTSIASWAETDDPQTLVIVEAIELETEDTPAKMRFANSWVLRGGKIAMHFAGMTQFPDGTVA
jgi:ketosteroid isomerase-like protein